MGLGIGQWEKGNMDTVPNMAKTHPGNQNTGQKGTRIKDGRQKHRFRTRRALTTTKEHPILSNKTHE